MKLLVLIQITLTLQCAAQESTSMATTPVSTTALRATSTMGSNTSVETDTGTSTIAPTTTAGGGNVTTVPTSATLTTSSICRPKLNLSPNLSPFWVKAVLLSVPATEVLSNCVWTDSMETRLLQLLQEGRAITGRRRKRRYAAADSLRLQLVSASRAADSDRVTLVYYAQFLSGSNFTYMPATAVVSAMTANSARAAAVLSYSVETLASVYDTSATESTSKLWVIGAVFGSLAGIMLIVWAVLFGYHKCLRPYEAPKYLAEVDEYMWTSESGYQSVDPKAQADKRRAGYTSAEIDELADQVAKRLDSTVARMTDRRHGRRRREQRRVGSSEDEESDDQEDTARRATSQRNAAYESNGEDEVDEEAAIESLGVKREQAVSAMPHEDRPKNGLDKDSKTKKRHENTERKRNKERLRKRAIDDSRVQPTVADEVDGSAGDQSQAAEPGRLETLDEFDLDPALILPAPNAFGMALSLPVTSRPYPSNRPAVTPSPYAAGDQIAKILPYLETDFEKHYNLRQQDQLDAEQHHLQLMLAAAQQQQQKAAPRAPEGPLLITVEPKPKSHPSGSIPDSASAVVMVLPAAANQDEWDVIRDCAWNLETPGQQSQARVPLAVLRREGQGLRDGASAAAGASAMLDTSNC